MADNIELNDGSGGAILATDDIGGVQHQRVKIGIGADGAYGDVNTSNPLPISDSGGSLTVDGSVGITGSVAVTNAGTFATQAAQSGTWTIQPGNTANTTPWLTSIHDGTTKATVRDLSSNDALNVAICDGSGNQITSFGGGTQYTEGDTDSSITGVAVLWEDVSDTLRPVSASYALPVQPGADTVFTVRADGGTFTIDGSVGITGSVAVTGTFWQATQPVSIAAAVAVTDNSGSLTVDAPVGTPVFVRLSDGSSAITTLPVSLASVPSHAVTNAGTFAVQADSVIPGTGATNLGKAIDTATGSTDTGVLALATRTDTLATLTPANGDNVQLRTNSVGAVWTAKSITASNDGITAYSLICASSSNATNVKNAAARLHWIMAFNTATTLRYVKIYNKASAPDPSTDTPVLRIPIPPNSSGISIPFPEPITLGTGLGFVIVTGQADNSTAVCTAGDVVLNLGYV